MSTVHSCTATMPSCKLLSRSLSAVGAGFVLSFFFGALVVTFHTTNSAVYKATVYENEEKQGGRCECPTHEDRNMVKETVFVHSTAKQEVSTNQQKMTVDDKRHYPLMLYAGFDDGKESGEIIGAYEGAANIVSYIWCGKKRLFEFKHMLSVLSAMKIQQPLEVNLYHWHGHPPREDLYNDWLSELKLTFYNFHILQLPGDVPEPANCADAFHRANSLSVLMKSRQYGGIFMDENVILYRPVNEYRKKELVIFQSNGLPGVVVGKNMTAGEMVKPRGIPSCISHNRMGESADAICLSIDVEQLYPRDIMTSADTFAMVARKLFYGSSEVKKPHFDLSDPIPNIGHFYLLGENKINFFIYLSIYSMISVLKVDMVYMHGDYEPTGYFWQKLQSSGKITYVFCPPVQIVFDNVVDAGDKFHGKDILSVYFLYLYGGVFVDWDAIFTKPLDDSVRGYDAVIGYDWFTPDEAPTFPEVLNPGVLAAKRHSVFISMWLDKYKEFGKKGGFYYTGLLVPYKIYEHYPETVKLDQRFQVICWEKTCHPPWMHGYQNPSFHSEFNWEEVYSVHFTYPDPHEFYTVAALRNATGMVARMGQRVMGWD